MSIEISPSIEQPLPTIKLWTPRTIGFLTFFIGFPSGITLASINWIKMGMKRKAMMHISICIIGIIVIALLPDAVGGIIGLALNLGYITLFRKQMKSDIEKITNNSVQYAHWLSGILVSFIGWVIVLIPVIIIFLIQQYIPGTSSYYYTRGNNYLDKEDFNNAIASYDKAIELDPQDVYSYNNRGLSYLNLGNFNRAIADCNEAIELDPNFDKPYYIRAYAYEGLGQTNDAIQDFEKVLELSTDTTLRNFAEEELQKLKGQ